MYFFGFTPSLSRKLHGSSLDITKAYTEVDVVRSALTHAREDDVAFKTIIKNMEGMAKKASVILQIPRICARQTHKNNIPAALKPK